MPRPNVTRRFTSENTASSLSAVLLMEWFKTYSNTPHLPQILALSDRAFRLWHDGRCYIAATESDGFIPAAQLSRFGNHGAKRYAVELVDRALWEQAIDGYIDVMWGVQGQLTSEVIAEARARNAKRQRQWQAARRNGVSNAVTDDVIDGVSNASRSRSREEVEEEEVGVAFGLRALTVVGDDW